MKATKKTTKEKYPRTPVKDLDLSASGHESICVCHCTRDGQPHADHYVIDGEDALGPIEALEDALTFRSFYFSGKRANEEAFPVLWPDIKQDFQHEGFRGNLADAGAWLQNSLHSLARKCGHWDNLEDGIFILQSAPERKDELVAQKLLLIHAEISEGVEGYRKDLMDDKLPHRTMLEAELADAAIRIFDLAGFLGFDLGSTIVEKSAFNADRPDHTLEERRKAGGKKF
jgi:hypothetical protein